MDREKTRELKRTAVVTSRLPHARRQQRALSSAHLNNCSIAKEHNPTAVSADANRRGAGEAAALMSGCKRKAKESKGSVSSEDCEIVSGSRSDGNEDELQPPPTTVAATAAGNRKRVKFIGKVSDDRPAVDPALVPRKLRSAINKRCGDTISQYLPNGKRKMLHVYKEIELPHLNAMKDKLSDPLTKDEEEVVEALFSLASVIADSKPDQAGTDDRSSPEDAEAKAAVAATASEASEGGAMKLSSLSTAVCPTIASHIEFPVEASKDNATREVTVADTLKVHSSSVLLGSKHVYIELNGITEVENQVSASVMKNEISPNLSGDIYSSYPERASFSAYPAKGSLQTTIQFETFQSQKSEHGLFPAEYASATRKQDIHYLNENSERSIVVTRQEALEMRNSTNNSIPVNSIGLLSTKPIAWQDSACCVASPAPTRNDLPTKKSSLVSTDSRQSWKKCATHVYIGHLIKKYQNTKKINDLVSSSQKKVNEATVLTANEPSKSKDSSSASGMHSCIVESNQPGARVGTQSDRKLPQVQQVHTTGMYSQQKQMYDFLSLSAGSEQATPGFRMESPGKIPVAYLHTLGPNHPMMPFSLPSSGHYSSPHSDHFAAAASQQVQLQLPHYLGNPFYGIHMGHAGGSTKHQLQQQQMWQAHLTHYGASPIPPKWQSARQPDPSSPLLTHAQLQSVIAHSPIEINGGSHHSASHPPLQHQVLSIPLPASNRSK